MDFIYSKLRSYIYELICNNLQAKLNFKGGFRVTITWPVTGRRQWSNIQYIHMYVLNLLPVRTFGESYKELCICIVTKTHM